MSAYEMLSADEKLLLTSLDRIEQREARLLTWGLVDGFLTSRELSDIIDPLLDDPEFADGLTYVSIAEVIAALKSRALLFDVSEQASERFRSRMAEGVRLFFRLRQLFPQHQGLTGWQAAPNLVADFRFIWRRRRYPRREITVADGLKSISAATKDSYARQAIEEFISSYGDNFKLAGFQVDAACRILSGIEENRSLATLVSAGTGSGKTLAFYLPALARIASHIRRDSSNKKWVKVLAVYPRNELLKDQFSEIYAQARRLDSSLRAVGRRKILIGTYFGPTPISASLAHEKKGWRSHQDGLVCEFLRCPGHDCDGDMVWRSADRASDVERLSCLECSTVIDSDEIILTRKRLERESPDILFTTTEMLNQRMGDNQYQHLFGIGNRAERSVEMMLLDEVHTYAGTSGAQVAYLLRRWRKMNRKPVSFVGLSATLKDGARFFARLTGLHELSSVEVTPRHGDMIAEGAEYLLALRGDPVSRTALLSTTIQTAMLLTRMLDSPENPISQGVLGERAFLFADNLDVINRLFFAMRDAEGRRSNGTPDMNTYPNGGLAVLRFPMSSELRKLHGQDWEAAVEIGHTLQATDRKRVERVMSMDPGVGTNFDLLVATASLEVGFNDPLVGGVIQHKAPRDVAQFLQRKGRAGRSRKMRPWTIAVLSDYGRDRVAYQGYDLLFDPELSPRTLPLSNRYVTRIQAVYATMDYLSTELGITRNGSVWTNLSGPAKSDYQRERQLKLTECIRRILTILQEQERYAAYLAAALRIDASEIEAILWEHPRPLLTEVLPTALRRLETGWLAYGQDAADYKVRNSPLPEFAPANLFSELNLPEVEIVIPPSGTTRPEPVMMPIVQAIREFAPGRVSRRYGLNHAFERHWICPNIDQNNHQVVPLEPYLRVDALGNWLITSGATIISLPVFRPRAYAIQQAPSTVVDTSNARIKWRTQIVARETGLILGPPLGNPWTPFINDIRFYSHHGLAPVEVRRFALGSSASIRYRDGTSYNKEFQFEMSGAAAALGFSISVDAFCLRLKFPTELWSDLGRPDDPRYRAMRTARFHDQARNGTYIELVDNVFAREWLAQLLLSAITNEAMAKSISLQEASDNLANNRADLSLEQTLAILFQSQVVDDANAQGNTQDKLRQDLSEFLANPQVRKGLFSLVTILWTPIDANWEPWLRNRFAVTVASAAFSAILHLCPEIDGDSLVVDIDPGPRESDDVLYGQEGTEIWITETSPGGNGQIEEALRQYSEDPRRFFSLMTSALRDNDFALSDHQITQFVQTVVETDPDGDVALATGSFRQAYGADQSHIQFKILQKKLVDAGFVTFHAFMVALVNRILRPGTSTQSDSFFLSAIRLWDAEEDRLGVELDARVIAYRLARRDDIDIALSFSGIDAPTIHPDQWRFSVVYGLLWPRGAQIRQAGLRLDSIFVDLPLPDPLLLRSFLDLGMDKIDLREIDWQQRCLEHLAERGAVTLLCSTSNTGAMAEALSFIATNPVQTDYLSVFARVQAVRRVGNLYEVDVDLAEALQ
jgi:hypothetical protein